MRSFLKKSLICSVVLALFIAYIPVENFALQVEAKNVEEKKSEEKEPIELVELRTENAKTFDNLDGTYTAEIAQDPIHYKDKQGNWEEIDNSLVETNNGKTVTNKANDFSVEIDKTTTTSQQNITITDDSKKIDFGLVSAQHETANKIEQVQNAKGVVDNNTIRYQNVLKDTDVVYTIGSNHIKEDIIYSEKPQDGFPKKIKYKLNVSGLTVEQIDQNIYLKDATTHKSLYMIEAPYMYDSYKPKGYKTVDEITSIPEEAKSYQLTLSYEVIGQDLFVYLEPDATWLQSKERVYPITIDPTIVRLQTSATMEDTTIRSANPTQTGGNDFELGVGTAVGGNTVRSLLKFDLSAVPSSTTILSTDLNLWFSSTNNNSPIDISLHKLTSPWEENQASWNNAKTTPYTAWKTAGGDFLNDKLRTVKDISVPPASIADAMVNWKVPLDVVQGWINNPTTNYGFMLKSDNETTQIYKKFASSEQSTLNKYKPQLVVTYKTFARLGLEDYWDYDSRPLVNGTNSVNLTTHNNILQYTDMSILGRADSGLTFTRTYNSKDYEKSAFGFGWSFTGDEKIFTNTGSKSDQLQYKDADGTIHVFTYNTVAKQYEGSAGNYDVIKKTSTDTFILYDLYGNQTIFKVRESTSDTDVEVAYITTQMDRNSNKIHYSYDNDNQLIEIATDLGKDVLNRTLKFEYESGMISKITYDDQQITYRYTSDGYLQYVDVLKDRTGNKTTTQFMYTNKFLTAIVDANNKRTKFEYNGADLKYVYEPTEDTTNQPKTEYSLDRATGVATIIDPEEAVTRYFVNNNFVVEKVISPAGEEKLYELDANYNLLKETETIDGVSKVLQKNTYDDKGNLLTTTDAENNIQTYTYTTFQNVKTLTDSKGKVSSYSYDDKGNLINSKIPSTNNLTETTYKYDDYGDLEWMETSDGIREVYATNYKDSKKIINHTDAHNNTTTTEQDLSGNITASIDGKQNETKYHYNLKNELETVIDAKQQQTSYEYDGNGNLNKTTNARGYSTHYKYNGKNQITQETNPLNDTTSYQYDENGELTLLQTAKGDHIEYKIDQNAPSSTVVVNGKIIWRYTKEGDDQLIYGENESTLKRISYYDNGLLKSIDKGDIDGDIMYEYVGEEYLSSLSFPGFKTYNTLKFVPDNAYNTKQIELNGNPLASFTYDDVTGQLKDTNFANGSKLSKIYNSGRLQEETLSLSNPVEWQKFTYEYDANNNLKSILQNSKNKVNYSYDVLNQLTQETYDGDGMQIDYTYDEAGNRLSKSVKKAGETESTAYRYNGANQLTYVNNQVYTYDNDGNLTNDGTNTYEWNAFDQLTKVKNNTGTVIAEYGYDEKGRRTYSKDSNGSIFYAYDGDSNRVLYEKDSSSYAVKSYVYDDNGHLLTMIYKGDKYHYLTNYRGDVLGMTDDSGNEVASYTYDAWGNILTQSGKMVSINPYRYAGYRYDENTKLYYLMARYYNPDTGVFLSLDPVRGDTMNPLSFNGYNYTNNNPVIYIDSDGHNPVLIRLLQVTVIPILKYLAKRYGPKLMKELNYIVSSNINRYLKQFKNQYTVNFGKGNLVSIVKKSGKGDRRIFSFEYATVTFLNGKKQIKEKAWHYHLANPALHYVFRWNEQYRKGYTFYDKKKYMWVW
ncbi:DNRLRE domain-containing protein [Lysinibacillus xylanilyticus]|uniref:DNRLRE domain-containing protein n=1 Tax=Lysinibacillus xylanilyticus TaxID=582475 RepID=UPI002B2502E5|nr:DNRLRE domain-containing protein [Lysinibacillus xylanilyticus]MEB2280169.1 DNRLRE domain-containing protein [Lysinibacillus xylanilyticus]